MLSLVASSDPLCKAGVCVSRLQLSTSTAAAPQAPPWQQQFWGGLPSSSQPGRGEQWSPTTSSPAEPSAHKPHCIPCCWCLGASWSSATSRNHPAGSKAVGNMDTNCTSLVLLGGGRKQPREQSREVLAEHPAAEWPRGAPSPSQPRASALQPCPATDSMWQLRPRMACSAPHTSPKNAVLTIYCRKAVGSFPSSFPGIRGRRGRVLAL